MQVRLGRTYKRPNSTLQCTNWVTIELDVYLKENTSFNSPTFVWQGDGLTIQKCNVAYEANSGTYYFIKDVVSISNNLVEIVCEKDVLATWKDIIGEHTTYIERSATGFDDMVRDTLITQSIDIGDVSRKTTAMPDWETQIPWLCYRACNSRGVTTYFTQKPTFLNPLMPSPEVGSVEEIFKDSWKATYQPFNYLLEVYAIPFGGSIINATGIGPIVSTIPEFGFLKYDTSWGTKSTNEFMVGEDTTGISINLPDRYFNDFRDFDDEWTSFNLFIPGIGNINIPAHFLQSDIKIKCYYDLITGDMNVNLYISEDENASIGCYNANVKCPIQFAAVNSRSSEVLGGALSVLGSAVSALSGGFSFNSETDILTTPSVGAIGNVGSSVSSAIKNINSPGAVVNGSNGGQIYYLLQRHNIIATAIRYKSKQIGTGAVGRPKYENAKINTMTGYIKCVNPSVFIPAQIDDMRQINDYLRNGFYYE